MHQSNQPLKRHNGLNFIVLLLCIALARVAAAQTAPAINPALSDVATTAGDVSPLKVGDKAPAVQVYTAKGEAVNLQDFYSSAPSVLIFYRGGWCPYCNIHLGKLATIEDALTSAGFQTLAISPDAPQYLQETADKHNSKYTLLSDSSAKAIRAFGLAYQVDNETVEKYRAFKEPIDLEKRAGETHHILPVPAAYVVNRSGTIRYAFWSPDYKVRVDEQELLEAAQQAMHEL